MLRKERGKSKVLGPSRVRERKNSTNGTHGVTKGGATRAGDAPKKGV